MAILRAIHDAMDRAWMEDILGLAAENGVALEVNGSALESASIPHYGEVYGDIVREARQAGGAVHLWL